MKTILCFFLLSILQLVSLKIEEVDLDKHENTLQIAVREQNLETNNNLVNREEDNLKQKYKSVLKVRNISKFTHLQAPRFHNVNSTYNIICTTTLLYVATRKGPQIVELQYPFHNYTNKEKLCQGKPLFKLDKIIYQLHPALLEYEDATVHKKWHQSIAEYNFLQSAFSRSKRSNTVHNNSDELHFDGVIGRADAAKMRVKVYGVDHRDSQGFTPLYQAVVNDHTDIAEQFLLAGADLNRTFFVEKRNLLHEAARLGAVKSIRWLVEKGLGVNSTDDVGRLPLHYAVINRQINATKILIDLKSCLDCRNGQGFTPLYEASVNGYTNIADVLVKAGANVQQTISSNHNNLHEAASFDDVESIRRLVDNGLSVNATDDDKWTPLHYAAHNGRLNATLTLLDLKCCIDCKNSGGVSALYKALAFNHIEIAAVLVEAGADLHQTFLSDHRNLLHDAAALNAVVSIRWLVQKGIDVNSTNDNSWTPLHFAATNGKLNATITLLDLKCCIDCKNSGKVSALYKALAFNNIEIAAVLVEAGADLHQTFLSDHRNLLHDAAALDAVPSIRWLVQKGIDVNSTNDNSWTPLHFAATNGKLKAAEILVELKSCILCKSSKGFIPLRYAEMYHHQDVAKFLKSL